MGNVASHLTGVDDSKPFPILRCPGAFPIDDDHEHSVGARQPRQKRKRSVRLESESKLVDNAATFPRHAAKKPRQQRQKPRNRRNSENEIASELQSSTIRARDASLVLEEGVSLERDFERLRLLGESTEGRVYKVRSKTGSVYALKVLRETAKSRYAANLPSECLLHLKIRLHPNLLFLSQIDITLNSEILMCTGYANAGDLFGQIKRFEMNDSTPPIFALHVFIQVSEALAYLHSGYCRIKHGKWERDKDAISIIHGDLKPENVLLHFDSNNKYGMPTIQLCDFGHCTPESKPLLLSGSPLYFCPEAEAVSLGEFSGPPLSTKSDVYCFGLTLHVLLTFSHWRTSMNPSKLKLPRAFNEIGFDGILKHCLAVSPRHRPSMNYSVGTGLLRCVDDAWTVRDELFRKEGPLSKTLWNLERE